MKVTQQQSQNSGRRKPCKGMTADVSPDSKCPICLDVFNNISYLDLCLHKFCFRCIQEWSKNKAECPLCKQPFNSIYHSIKSEQDFKQYDLQPLDNGSFGTFGGVRFRYRTTLTGINRQRQGRTSLPPDNGVMFEASTNNPQQPQDRYIQHMMMRLESRRRAEREGRAVSNIQEQEMINFRRELYRRGVRVRSVRDRGRTRDVSADFLRSNPACLHRLVPWLKRELTVLYGSHGSLVNIVQHIVMSQITRYDMDDGAIQEELRPFLLGRTEHFLHEFSSFAKSPFDMKGYDRVAVYDCPAPSNEDSSPNSSVIAISEDEEQPVSLDPSGGCASSLSNSVWDDETPGPSYSTTTEENRTQYLSVHDSDSESSLEEGTQAFGTHPQQMTPLNQTTMIGGEVNNDEHLSSDGDDCLIVGFIKPLVERTPELVNLSSDSESTSENGKEMSPLPQHIHFSSLSPLASKSSDQSSAGQSENVASENCHPLNSKERHRRLSMSDRKDRDKRFGSSDGLRERHRSKDRDRRRRRRSRSGEHGNYSRSPAVSHSRVSRVRGSYSSTRTHSKIDTNHKSSDDDESHRHSQERNYSGIYFPERWSKHYSGHKQSDDHSRSRSGSRESQKWERRHSRYRTFSSSRSPSAKKRYYQDKPGGKRKYKARHLEELSENVLSNSPTSTKHEKKSKEKHRKNSKERSRKNSGSHSTEPFNEENCERSKHRHKKKKKHKKKSKRQKSCEHRERRSPTIITVESDSDLFPNDSVTQASSANKDSPITDAPSSLNT